MKEPLSDTRSWPWRPAPKHHSPVFDTKIAPRSEYGSVSIVRGLRIQLSKDSRHSEQEEGKVLHTSYLCSEAFHLRVERLC